MVKGCVHKLINSWNREGVFKISLVEISEVYGHSPFTGSLFDNLYVSQPFGIENFLIAPAYLS